MKQKLFLGILFLLLSAHGFTQEMSRLDSALFEAEKRIETDNRSNFKNVESMIVSHNGTVILERYFYGVNKDSLHRIQSQTFSILSLLLGIAIDHGYVASEDNRVASYFPEYFKKGDTLKSQIRIRDLITMSAGMKWNEMVPIDNPSNDNGKMMKCASFLDFALSRPITRKPGLEFGYCSGYPIIVAAVIQKATRMSLDVFAKKYLFDPLEIRSYLWEKDPSGLADASGGLWLKPADLMKISELILHEGRWKNVRIISESWIQRSMQQQYPTPFPGYGFAYFWWTREVNLSTGKTIRIIAAQGAGGQNLYILPEYALSVSFTESNFGTPVVGPYILNTYIIPSLE